MQWGLNQIRDMRQIEPEKLILIRDDESDYIRNGNQHKNANADNNARSG